MFAALLHPSFLSAFFAWLLSGLIKFVVDHFQHQRTTLADDLIKTGGMPSMHCATMTAVTMSVYFLEGFSTLFFVAAILTLVIIRDSFGVRFSVGEQAKMINTLLKHDDVHKKVKVVLGHTVLQSVAGVLLGGVIAFLVHIVV